MSSGVNEHLRDAALEIFDRMLDEATDWEDQKDRIGTILDVVWWAGWHEGFANCHLEWDLDRGGSKQALEGK